MGDDDLSERLLGGSTSRLYMESAQLSPDIHGKEKATRKKLEWYFKTPYDKYKDDGRKPFKLLLQVIKIIVITVQGTWFAMNESSIIQFSNDNVETFRNVFILDYHGNKQKNLYTRESVYKHMLYVWQQYYRYDDINTGTYNLVKMNNSIKPIYFCETWSRDLPDLALLQIPYESDPSDYHQAPSDPTKCHYLKPPQISTNKTTLAEFMQQNHIPERIGWISSMTLSYSFQMNYSIVHHESSCLNCYMLNVDVIFDNQDLDGIMTLSLNSDINFQMCHETRERMCTSKLVAFFDFTLIILCLVSAFLCIRSFRRHFKTYQDTKSFFIEYRHEELKFSDKIVFIDSWLIMIVISDTCAITGSSMKLCIDVIGHRDLYTACSLCFGLAVLFSWIGVLRYLGFVKGYNTLLITLKVAFPLIIRFICCVVFIYIGFVICGWIIFGPYHVKFSDLLMTSECLFSLLNGDDMYPTFSLMEKVMPLSPLICYVGKCYLYIFISLFIFVVLSLFIGIARDTFEKIKDAGCAPKTRLQMFTDGKEYEERE